MPRTDAQSIEIRPMEPGDWAAVREIYAQGIATGDATFETEPPGWEAWDRDHLTHSRLIALSGKDVLGWAALSPVSGRCVYAGVAEVSVYVGEAARGAGVGTKLLEALIRASEARNVWTLEAGIFGENEASIAIHERCGFRRVGVRERLGALRGVWRDVVLMERRSDRVG